LEKKTLVKIIPNMLQVQMKDLGQRQVDVRGTNMILERKRKKDAG
jgi:hypothetical protein